MGKKKKRKLISNNYLNENDIKDSKKRKNGINSDSQKEEFKEDLPIYSARYKIIEEIKNNPSVIIIGETGSGKTTQVVQYIYKLLGKNKEHRGGIAITQPRRIAAITTANRVAEEMGCEIGGLVGYSVRFEEKTSPQTKIKFLTDGMLLRECMISPNLSRYKYIILDEAHERSIQTDILCAIVKQIQQTKRPDLKIIIMSATIDAKLFESYFNAKVLYVEGRQFPVQIYYTAKPESNYLDATVITALQIHLEEPPGGDILAFLTGRDEIEDVARVLEEKGKMLPINALKLIVCPLYAAQTTSRQKKAFEPTPQGCRKIILATNIAETSITVPNIKYVIDSGLVKMRQQTDHIDVPTNNKQNIVKDGPKIDLLSIVPISKAQAWQRAGRAGRTQPGKAYRLYTEKFFLEKLKDNQVPEIKRVDLSNLILQMMAIGIEDPVKFPYIEAPKKKALISSLQTLFILGAIDKSKKLTPIGRQMSLFPIEPKYSKVLIKSKELDCVNEVITVVAMLSVDNVFWTPPPNSNYDEDGEKSLTTIEVDSIKRAFSMSYGDHILYLNVFNAFMNENKNNVKQWCKNNFVNYRTMLKVCDIRNQLVSYWEQYTKEKLHDDFNVSITSDEWKEKCELVCKSFITGFFQNVAILTPNKTYETIVDRKTVSIHPSSSLFQSKVRCILYDELVYTSNYYMRDVISIDRSWLVELVPDYFQRTEQSMNNNNNDTSK